MRRKCKQTPVRAGDRVEFISSRPQRRDQRTKHGPVPYRSGFVRIGLVTCTPMICRFTIVKHDLGERVNTCTLAIVDVKECAKTVELDRLDESRRRE